MTGLLYEQLCQYTRISNSTQKLKYGACQTNYTWQVLACGNIGIGTSKASRALGKSSGASKQPHSSGIM